MRHSGRTPTWWADGIGEPRGDRRHAQDGHQAGADAEPVADIAERIAADPEPG